MNVRWQAVTGALDFSVHTEVQLGGDESQPPGKSAHKG